MDLIWSVVWWMQTKYSTQSSQQNMLGKSARDHFFVRIICIRQNVIEVLSSAEKITKLTFPRKQKRKYSFGGHLTPWPLIRSTLVVCKLHLHTHKWHTIDSMWCTTPNTLWKCGSKWSVEFNKNVSAKYFFHWMQMNAVAAPRCCILLTETDPESRGINSRTINAFTSLPSNKHAKQSSAIYGANFHNHRWQRSTSLATFDGERFSHSIRYKSPIIIIICWVFVWLLLAKLLGHRWSCYERT